MGETELCSTLSLFIRALLKIGRRGTAPVKETLAVYGSGEFLYAYGTQANVNQVGLPYLGNGYNGHPDYPDYSHLANSL